MKKMFRATSDSIIEIEILKRTEKFVFLKNGRRESIHFGGAYLPVGWFESRDEAKAAVVGWHERKASNLQNQLHFVLSDLEKAKSL